MKLKSLTLALAVPLGALLPAVGCDTQDVRANVMVSLPLGGETPAPGLGTWLYIFTARDECPAGDANCPWFNLRIDGKMVVWPGTYDYVEAASLNMTGLIIPPGTHVIELVETRTGAVLVKTPALEMRPDMLHNLAVFGPANALQQRWFVDDPALVPQGLAHTRVLNALASADPIQPVQCTDTGGVNCTAMGAPLAHGDMVEADLTDEQLETFGWKLVRPGITDAVVNRVSTRRSGPAGDAGYVFQMPVRVWGNDGTCPSCLQASF
jgi:hypothetical protein